MRPLKSSRDTNWPSGVERVKSGEGLSWREAVKPPVWCATAAEPLLALLAPEDFFSSRPQVLGAEAVPGH